MTTVNANKYMNNVYMVKVFVSSGKMGVGVRVAKFVH